MGGHPIVFLKKKKNHKWWTIQMGLGIKKKLFGLSNGLGHG